MRANLKITNLGSNKKLVEELLGHIEAIERIKFRLGWEGKTDISIELTEDIEDQNAVSGN